MTSVKEVLLKVYYLESEVGACALFSSWIRNNINCILIWKLLSQGRVLRQADCQEENFLNQLMWHRASSIQKSKRMKLWFATKSANIQRKRTLETEVQESGGILTMCFVLFCFFPLRVSVLVAQSCPTLFDLIVGVLQAPPSCLDFSRQE